VLSATERVQGLRELAARAGADGQATPPVMASAIDFVLEGLCAQRKISRSEERGYSAGTEGTAKARGRREEPVMEEDIRIPGGKKKYYN
jgi:magnesium chelatase subunit I